MKIEPLKFAVNNFIPQGMTILAGSPKIGKSWMAMQMCIAVATGGKFLGENCDKGEAVYLSPTGSMGITGTADTNIMLSRDRVSTEAKLMLTSREIEERVVPLMFNTETFKWELSVMPEPGVLNMAAVQLPLTDAIVAILKEHGAISAKMVQGFLADDYRIDRTEDDIRRNLCRLHERNLIDKAGYGKYMPVGFDPETKATANLKKFK